MSGGTLLLDDTVISNTAATSVRTYPWRAVQGCVHGFLRKDLRAAALRRSGAAAVFSGGARCFAGRGAVQ